MIYKHHTEPVRGPQEPWTGVLNAEQYPIGIPHDFLRAFYGPKIVGSPCWKVAHTGLKSSKNVAGSHNMSWDYPHVDVTGAFGWFRTDFPRAIDSYDTQPTRARDHPYYLVANYDSRTYKSPWERERKRRREGDSERETMPYCLIRVSLTWSLKSYIFKNEPEHENIKQTKILD